ncbi:MAG: antibiotic biosynthesis monooxygenase [Desulfobacterales bacterium]|nr:MAG: antibiotic biosynthesis monooxygenase [Desulfobacterales bacterium]
MIYVIATIELNEGCKDDFLKIFNSNVPNVRDEEGCVTYVPTVDVDSGMPVQDELRSDVVTVVEAWDSLDALHQHLKAPHMASYRENVKDLVKQVSLQVMQPV